MLLDRTIGLATILLVSALLLPGSAHAGCGKGGGGEKKRRGGGGFGGVGISIDLGTIIDRAARDTSDIPVPDPTYEPVFVNDDPQNTPQDDDLAKDLADAYAKEFGGATVAPPTSRTPPPQGAGPPVIAQPAPTVYGEAPEGICGIHLEMDIDSWIPAAHTGDKTTLTAKIYRKAGNDWVYPGPPRVITFDFVKRSNEKGECLNHGEGREPDLFFPALANAGRLDCLNDPVGQGKHFNTARTRAPVTVEQVVAESDDYGSFSTVRATAPPCVPLERTPNGKLVEVPQPQADVKVPRDDNDNQIADAYERREGRQPKANDDDDKVPEGNGVVGDGLSAYEEYRGFLVQGEHVRTKWNQKDLFIFDRDSLGLGLFPAASGFACHLIQEKEFSAERVINTNGGHANLVEQHGLRMINEEMDGVSGNAGLGPPVNVDLVRIDKSDFVFGVTRKTYNDTACQAVIAHELGHATGAAHHSDFVFASEGGYKIFYPPGGVPTSSKVANAVSVLIPLFELVRDDYVEQTAATLCGATLPQKFWIGTKGNRHSGNTSCFMRYRHQDNRTVYQGAGGWECIGDEPPRELFCESRSGTGYNAGGKCAADAVVGDCKHQLVVNDASE